MAHVNPWPDALGEHGEIVELFEETLVETTRSSDELRARAEELREEAGNTEILGHREAALAMADRYEQAAAARLTSR